jgi:glyoxylase I family protein
MPEVIGIDHIYITASDMSRSEAFYDLLLRDVLRFNKAGKFNLESDEHINYYNRHFGVVIRPARVVAKHEPYSPGLHHFCFRVESHAEVAEVTQQLRAAGINATDAKLYPQYAEDYFATFFVDPDSIRLEVTNYRAERKHRNKHWEEVRPNPSGRRG